LISGGGAGSPGLAPALSSRPLFRMSKAVSCKRISKAASCKANAASASLRLFNSAVRASFRRSMVGVVTLRFGADNSRCLVPQNPPPARAGGDVHATIQFQSTATVLGAGAWAAGCVCSVTPCTTGSCSTVARCPSQSCVTSTRLPSGNSMASW